MAVIIMGKEELEAHRRTLVDQHMADIFLQNVIPSSLHSVLGAHRFSQMSDKLHALIVQDQTNEAGLPGSFWDTLLDHQQWQLRWPRRSIKNRVELIRASFPILRADDLSSDSSLHWLHRIMSSDVDTYYAIGSDQCVVIAEEVRGLSDLMVIRFQHQPMREDQKRNSRWTANQRTLSNRMFCYGLLSAWKDASQPMERRLIARDALISDLRTIWAEAEAANTVEDSPFIYRCGKSDVRAFQSYMHRRVEFDDDTPNGAYVDDFEYHFGYYAVPHVYENGQRLLTWLRKMASRVWDYLTQLKVDQASRLDLDSVVLPPNWPWGEKRSVTEWIVEGMNQLNLDQALVEFSFAFTCLVTYRGYRYDRTAQKGDDNEGEGNPVVDS